MHEWSRFATCRIWFITYSGAFAIYFRPYRRAFDSLSAPAPGNLPSIRKEKGNFPGVSPGGGGRAQLELTDALSVTRYPEKSWNEPAQCVNIRSMLIFWKTDLWSELTKQFSIHCRLSTQPHQRKSLFHFIFCLWFPTCPSGNDASFVCWK